MTCIESSWDQHGVWRVLRGWGIGRERGGLFVVHSRYQYRDVCSVAFVASGMNYEDAHHQQISKQGPPSSCMLPGTDRGAR